jgi:hypothetical protein
MSPKNWILIWTCLNTSRMSFNFPPFLGANNLSGYGALVTNDLGGSLTIGVTIDGSASFSLLVSPFCLLS